MSIRPIVMTIQVGKPRYLGTEGADTPMDQKWESAIYKLPVDGPVWLSKENLQGDLQANSKLHGGLERAVLAYPEIHYSFWRQKLGLPEMTIGSLGENFVISGATEKDVCVGDVYQIGDAIIQVSQPRQPCWKLVRRWKFKELALLAQNTGRTGWLYRVLKEGFVERGQSLILQNRPYSEFTIEQVNMKCYSRNVELETALKMASCPSLEESWRVALMAGTKGLSEEIEGRVFGEN